MKRYNYFLILILSIVIFASCNRMDSKRDKIIFNDKSLSIRDSLLKIIPLLNKIQNNDIFNKGYDYRRDSLYINNQFFDVKEINSLQALSRLDTNEKKELAKIANYLYKNEIAAGSFDKYLSLWLFEYRYLPAGDSSDSRVITMLSNSDEARIKSKVIVLDNKEGLTLLKFR